MRIIAIIAIILGFKIYQKNIFKVQLVIGGFSILVLPAILKTIAFETSEDVFAKLDIMIMANQYAKNALILGKFMFRKIFLKCNL